APAGAGGSTCRGGWWSPCWRRSQGCCSSPRRRAPRSPELRGAGPLAAVVVGEPDDVIQLGAGDLEQLDAFEGLVAVHPANRDQPRFARPELSDLDRP